MKKLFIGRGRRLTLADLTGVARSRVSVELAPAARRAMLGSLRLLGTFFKKRLPVYGATTQFGNQAHLVDPHLNGGDEAAYTASINERQSKLVLSHDCGVGEPVDGTIVRAAMLLRAHCLSLGYSGVRPAVSEALLALLSAGITPVVRRDGSIGASGDLLPLSGIAAALIGAPRPVVVNGMTMNAPAALKRARLSPLELEGREGLALINGTSFSTAAAALALADLERLFPQMLGSIAMSLEALQVMDSGYESVVHRAKGHVGQIAVNEWLRRFFAGSKLIRRLEASRNGFRAGARAKASSSDLQDYYSLRSVPQGFGPLCENIPRARGWIETEMNSANDNPIVHQASGKVLHASNFMGYYVTSAADMLKADIAQASSWLHALLANLVHPRKNFGLPANLVRDPERDSGFRPLQILVASLAVGNRKRAQNQQAFMVPTEGDNQDVNSLSKHAAFELADAVETLERITAVLFMAAAQALELRGVRKAGVRARKAHANYRRRVRFLAKDRLVADDLEATIKFLKEVAL